MDKKLILQKISEEIMRFMRGKYKLDEIPGKYYDIDCLKFRQGKKTILSINIHEDHYDFQIIYGKAERKIFEDRINEFPKNIQELYNNSRVLSDGLWMLIRVDNLKTLEAVKQMILIKKKPNRKPFPKKNAIYADCGHRCDLCVHYTGAEFSDEFRIEIGNRIENVYDLKGKDYKPIDSIQELYRRRTPCDGCYKGGVSGKFDCYQRNCAKENGTDKCINCTKYPCDKACVGLPPKIHTRTIYAEDVTWGILPFVYKQYGN
jgi:hypothetical protein